MSSGMRLTTFLALAVAAAFVIFASSRDSNAALPTFTPGGIICFENFDAFDYHSDETVRKAHECDGSAEVGATSDTRIKFCVGWNDDCTALDPAVTDSNFGGVTGFIPLAAVIKKSSEYPAGALVGRLSADAVLGVLSNACRLPIGVGFTLMNATTDIDGVKVYPKPIGQPDVMKPLAADTDNNGIPDGADKYPAFLISRFDVDHDFGADAIPNTSLNSDGQPASTDDVNGPIPPLKPIVRLFGTTKIYGMWITLNFLVFEPGVTILGPDRNPMQLNPNLGYPTAIALQDPTVPLAPGPITDFCAPLNTRVVSFGLTRDNPCSGLDTGATRGNCPSEIETGLENLGYPLLPCETNNNIDEDSDTKVNDGCPVTGTGPSPETGAQCDNATNDDPLDTDSDINDGCPQVGDVSEASYIGNGGCAGSGGNEGGCDARKNSPVAGTVEVPIGTQSLRDADGDGIDNTLDVCALKPNPEWDARWNPALGPNPNDSDDDGLPNACDPTPTTKDPNSSAAECEKGIVGPDYDQDCYANRQDNCPLTNQLKDPSKPGQFNVPAKPFDNVPQLFDKDADGIGDACDITACPASDTPAYTVAECQLFGVSQNGTSADGTLSQDGGFAVDCVTFSITVGPGAPARGPAPVHNTDPNCLAALGAAATPAPTRTLAPGETPGAVCVVNCQTGSGIGSLSPVAGSVPAWAAILAGFGGAGLIGGLGLIGSRYARRRE